MLYTHRHGIDVFAYSTKKKAEKAYNGLLNDPSFEGEEREEFLELDTITIDSNLSGSGIS